MKSRDNADRALPQREGEGALDRPRDAVVTETISRGATGRHWHLPFTGTLQRCNPERGEGPISITIPDEAMVIRRTCEFLRDNAGDLYRQLWRLMRLEYPANGQWPDVRRLARDVVHPDTKGTLTYKDTQAHNPAAHSQRPGPIPSRLSIGTIDKDHWVYRRHHEPGHYISARSGDPSELARREAEHDINTIVDYIERYEKLSKEVKGKTLWRATHEPGFRDPYLTCMELCLEMQVPSHFLAFIHYGIGIQLMHETSLPWERKFWHSANHKALHDTIKDSFRALARLYREDFGQALPAS
jgi:hypothetical protein